MEELNLHTKLDTAPASPPAGTVEDGFCKEGWELPDYVTEFDRPGIKIWKPEGGWEQAWAEARELLSEKEWKQFIGEATLTPAPPPEASSDQEQLGLLAPEGEK